MQLDTEGRVFHVLGRGTRLYYGAMEERRAAGGVKEEDERKEKEKLIEERDGRKEEEMSNLVEEEKDNKENKKERTDGDSVRKGKETPISTEEEGERIVTIKRLDSGAYRMMVGDKQPLVLLADGDGERGRALLLAICDYLLVDVSKEEEERGLKKDENKDVIVDQNRSTSEGEESEKQTPKGREKEEETNKESTNEKTQGQEDEEGDAKEKKEMVVVIGVFVRVAQPFLQEVLIALHQSGLDPHHTHFYIHNQVQLDTEINDTYNPCR